MANKKEKPVKKEVKIQGIVSSAGWDEDDNVTSIMIVTEEDEEYLIEPSEKEEDLMDFLDRYVEVIGSVRDHHGDQILSVKAFKLLSDDDEYDKYDDDDDDDGGYYEDEF